MKAVYIMMVSRRILSVRNVPYKNCRESENTHFMFNNYLSKIVPFMR
jgi:hypothetical protein